MAASPVGRTVGLDLDSGQIFTTELALASEDAPDEAQKSIWAEESHSSAGEGGDRGEAGEGVARLSFRLSKTDGVDCSIYARVRSPIAVTVALARQHQNEPGCPDGSSERGFLEPGRSVVLKSSGRLSSLPGATYHLTARQVQPHGPTSASQRITVDLVWLRSDDLLSRVSLLDEWTLHPVVGA